MIILCGQLQIHLSVNKMFNSLTFIHKENVTTICIMRGIERITPSTPNVKKKVL